VTVNRVKFLYLPIEIWSREFHAKTLLALHGASNGWSVVMGPKSEMHRRLSRLPRGVVLQFGFHKNYAIEMKKLRSCGHKIVAADEEGLVTLSPEHYKRYRVSSKTLEQCDKCYCWGEIHAQMVREVDSSVDQKLHVTGNPRMDLLRPAFRDLVEREAAGLRAQYGRFLLLNGNFGSFNHAMGIDYTWKSLEAKGWASTQEDKDFHHRRVELQGRFFQAFHSVIPKIATEDRKVVVRPHPSESLVPWEKLSKAYPGKIIVVREGNVVPWLQAAEAVLHNGCTTAVEAFFLGRPVIAFRPERNLELETELPNHISMQASTEDELIALLEKVAEEDSRSREERLEYAQKFIVAGDGPFSCERIVEALPEVETHPVGKLNSLGFLVDRVYFNFRNFVGKLVHRQSSAYLGLKCGKLDLHQTREILQAYSSRSKLASLPQASSLGNGLIKIG
jgi:surface carbohydrate biosynthesis protein